MKAYEKLRLACWKNVNSVGLPNLVVKCAPRTLSHAKISPEKKSYLAVGVSSRAVERGLRSSPVDPLSGVLGILLIRAGASNAWDLWYPVFFQQLIRIAVFLRELAHLGIVQRR